MILQHYKIVLAGTMGAGKTTAIQTISNIDVISTEAINSDTEAHSKALTTVGIDYGELTLEDGTKVGLYGTPGQQRFDFIWDVITKGALGCILLIDHSAQNPLQDLNQYVDYFSEKHSNLVIAISHLDRASTVSTRIYHDWNAARRDPLPLFFIDARNKEQLLSVLNALICNAEVQQSFIQGTTAC